MADDSKGVLGHLPPLPRAALNNSVIAMEQAYRKRKGLPTISDADVEALKAGAPMSWEDGGSGVVVAAPAAPAATAPSATAAAVAVAAPAATSSISEEVAKWVAEGKKWSKSAIAAEQARRKRKNLTPLNDAEASALLGEPVETEVPAAAAAAATPAPAAAAPSGPISEEVRQWVAEGKKWSKSTVAAEQARRKRKNLPALTDAEVVALLGEPVEAAAPAPAFHFPGFLPAKDSWPRRCNIPLRRLHRKPTRCPRDKCSSRLRSQSCFSCVRKAGGDRCHRIGRDLR